MTKTPVKQNAKRRFASKLLMIGLAMVVVHLYLANSSFKPYPVSSDAVALTSKSSRFTGLQVDNVHAGDKVFKPEIFAKDIEEIGKVETQLNEIKPAAGLTGLQSDKGFAVQAVLAAKRIAVISGTMDGKLTKFPLQNGDTFKKGHVIAKYDCGIDWARLKELKARERLSAKKTAAFKRLLELKTASEIEYVTALENNNQDKAQISQLRHKLNLCSIHAPFSGRVSRKIASQYESVQKGRVLMEIISSEPMQAELLIPSKWLRWANVKTPLSVYIEESGKTYNAHITRIHGEIDPVSQSAHVVAELEKYEEELLPGMSGRAIFDPEQTGQKDKVGFLGIVFEEEVPEIEMKPSSEEPPAIEEIKQESAPAEKADDKEVEVKEAPVKTEAPKKQDAPKHDAKGTEHP